MLKNLFKRNRRSFMLYSHLSGKLVPLRDVSDEVFSSGMLGDGIAVEHIGLDTVKLKGKGFDIKVKEGDRVNKGDLLCIFDTEIIKNAGLKTTTPMVITNSGEYSKIEARPQCDINAGDSVLKIEK